jgi:membrane protease YdiL (CAAX protease family)
VLTLVEEGVFRVVFQERMSWYTGTPAAIGVAAVLFGLAHAVGATGSPAVVLMPGTSRGAGDPNRRPSPTARPNAAWR